MNPLGFHVKGQPKFFKPIDSREWGIRTFEERKSLFFKCEPVGSG